MDVCAGDAGGPGRPRARPRGLTWSACTSSCPVTRLWCWRPSELLRFLLSSTLSFLRSLSRSFMCRVVSLCSFLSCSIFSVARAAARGQPEGQVPHGQRAPAPLPPRRPLGPRGRGRVPARPLVSKAWPLDGPKGPARGWPADGGRGEDEGKLPSPGHARSWLGGHTVCSGVSQKGGPAPRRRPRQAQGRGGK